MPETHELLTCSPIELWEWVNNHPSKTFSEACDALRDAIVAACRADEAERITTAKREAASDAWDAAANHAMVREMTVVGSDVDAMSGRFDAARDRYLDNEHPLPARECVLSDGSVVTYSGGTLHRSKGNEPRAGATLRSWFCLLSPEHTGADWDALKAFAAGRGEG